MLIGTLSNRYMTSTHLMQAPPVLDWCECGCTLLATVQTKAFWALFVSYSSEPNKGKESDINHRDIHGFRLGFHAKTL